MVESSVLLIPQGFVAFQIFLPVVNQLLLHRMAARGRGRGHGRGNAEEDLPPPPTMAEVLHLIETNRHADHQVLQAIMQNTMPRGNNCSSIADFLKSQPPRFSVAREPLDADDWLRTMERKFEALHVPDNERVNFSTYMLEGAVGSWWEGYRASVAQGHAITWEEFRTAFRARYIPQALMDLKRREFLELTQGKKDVASYG